MSETNFCVEHKRSIWERLGFHEASVHRPEELESEPEYAPSWFIVQTTAHLDWKDRLRVLISGNVSTHCSIKTDRPIEKNYAISQTSVMAPGRPREAKRNS